MLERIKMLTTKAEHSLGILVQRWPINYFPWTTAGVNYDRLPPAATLSTMELAYRQEGEEDDALSWKGKFHLLVVFSGSLAAALGCLIVGPMFTFQAGVTLGGDPRARTGLPHDWGVGADQPAFAHRHCGRAGGDLLSSEGHRTHHGVPHLGLDRLLHPGGGRLHHRREASV